MTGRVTRRVAFAAASAVLLANAAMPLARRGSEGGPFNINILVEGQSNAWLFLNYGGGALLGSRVRALLGLHDGQTLTLLGGVDQSMWGGVGLVHGARGNATWLTAAAHGTWRDDALQRQFVAYLHGLPATLRHSPTVTVWLHNESDSTNQKLTRAAWESAIRHSVAEARDALGQQAARTPVDFVFVPSDCPDRCMERSGAWREVLALRAGYEDLEADPGFNAVNGAQIGDADMDGLPAAGQPPQNGGLHMDARDVAVLAGRLSLTIANQLWRYAQPGSPEARARGALPAQGPRAVAAARVDRRRLSVAVALEAGSAGLQGLSEAASHGAGWDVVRGKTVLHGVAAQVVDGRVVVRFAKDVPDDAAARLYYGWGSGRIAPEAGLDGAASRPPGRNAAIYDSNGLPLWMPASGLAIGPG